MKLYGYVRGDGRVGARNHILVLPSVVCADLAAQEIAKDGGVAIIHQHGCAQVGDDVTNTEQIFTKLASNPNVGAVIVVSLGCETIGGKKLSHLIADVGQRVEFVGIQALGGTYNTIRYGSQILEQLKKELDLEQRKEVSLSSFLLGIDGEWSHVVEEVAKYAEEVGIKIIKGQEKIGPLRHVEVAAMGAQVILSFATRRNMPTGFAVCPVFSVTDDQKLYDALEYDFDMLIDVENIEASATTVVERLIDTFNGFLTAAEKRQSFDFALPRLARSM